MIYAPYSLIFSWTSRERERGETKIIKEKKKLIKKKNTCKGEQRGVKSLKLAIYKKYSPLNFSIHTYYTKYNFFNNHIYLVLSVGPLKLKFLLCR